MRKFFAFLILVSSTCSYSQTVNLSAGKFVSDKNVTVERINCYGTNIQFARGVRWTPPDYSPVLSFNDKQSVTLPPSCYDNMSCVIYRGTPSLLVIDSPACGGTALPEQYLVFDLMHMGTTTLSYQQAKSARLIH